MKHFLLIMAVLGGAVIANAELFTPGKSWLFKSWNIHEPGSEYYYKEYVDGDTIIDGITATRLRCESLDSEGGTWYRAALEDDGKVFRLYGEDGEKVLLMDFNVTVGEKMDVVLDGDMVEPILEGYYTVGEILEMEIEGISRRVIAFGTAPDYRDHYWIEGIGSPDNAYLTWFASHIGDLCEMVECYEDGKCIFSKERFDQLVSGVEERIVSPSEEVRLYDLSGRPVQTPRKGEVYIKGSEKVVW